MPNQIVKNNETGQILIIPPSNTREGQRVYASLGPEWKQAHPTYEEIKQAGLVDEAGTYVKTMGFIPGHAQKQAAADLGNSAGSISTEQVASMVKKYGTNAVEKALADRVEGGKDTASKLVREAQFPTYSYERGGQTFTIHSSAQAVGHAPTLEQVEGAKQQIRHIEGARVQDASGNEQWNVAAAVQGGATKKQIDMVFGSGTYDRAEREIKVEATAKEEAAVFQQNHIKLDSGEWIARAEYSELNEREQAELNHYGVDRFNRMNDARIATAKLQQKVMGQISSGQERIQREFEANHVQDQQSGFWYDKSWADAINDPSLKMKAEKQFTLGGMAAVDELYNSILSGYETSDGTYDVTRLINDQIIQHRTNAQIGGYLKDLGFNGDDITPALKYARANPKERFAILQSDGTIPKDAMYTGAQDGEPTYIIPKSTADRLRYMALEDVEVNFLQDTSNSAAHRKQILGDIASVAMRKSTVDQYGENVVAELAALYDDMHKLGARGDESRFTVEKYNSLSTDAQNALLERYRRRETARESKAIVDLIPIVGTLRVAREHGWLSGYTIGSIAFDAAILAPVIKIAGSNTLRVVMPATKRTITALKEAQLPASTMRRVSQIVADERGSIDLSKLPWWEREAIETQMRRNMQLYGQEAHTPQMQKLTKVKRNELPFKEPDIERAQQIAEFERMHRISQLMHLEKATQEARLLELIRASELDNMQVLTIAEVLRAPVCTTVYTADLLEAAVEAMPKPSIRTHTATKVDIATLVATTLASKTVTALETRILAGVAIANPKLMTELSTKLALDTATKTKLLTALKTAVSVATQQKIKTQLQTAIKTLTATKTATMTKVATIPAVDEMVATITELTTASGAPKPPLEATPKPTSRRAPPPPPKPPRRGALPPIPDIEIKNVSNIPLDPGEVVWRQGMRWIIIKPPYHKGTKSVEYHRKTPSDAPRRKGTPKQTIYTRNGAPPKRIEMDMGFEDVTVHRGRKITFEFDGYALKRKGKRIVEIRQAPIMRATKGRSKHRRRNVKRSY